MIAPEKLLEAAKALEPQLQEWRRTLHRHPEVGFDLPQTKALVKKALTEMGYTPQDCGKCGVIALAGGKRPGKVILLRGDMDALPLQEESGEEFSSELPGKMHGCGHDMHTAMVLGAAKLLKEHEDEIEGTVKLEFQPAEEIFQGSLDMINSGLLENPKVDAAVMFHVLAGMPLPAGMVLVPGGGITMASCEQYHIVVHGKGGHGSMPNACIDPITAAAHIHIALQEINSRELDPAGFGVFTTGRFEAGKASNVIPDTADMWGTIRTVDPEQKVSALIHQRMTEIAQGVATAYRCTAEVEFSDYCPCMVVDTPLAGNALTYMTELLGKGAMDMTPLTGGKPGGGSEDFAFVSHEVPTVSMFLAAGNAKEGYTYGQHTPRCALMTASCTAARQPTPIWRCAGWQSTSKIAPQNAGQEEKHETGADGCHSGNTSHCGRQGRCRALQCADQREHPGGIRIIRRYLQYCLHCAPHPRSRALCRGACRPYRRACR